MKLPSHVTPLVLQLFCRKLRNHSVVQNEFFDPLEIINLKKVTRARYSDIMIKFRANVSLSCVG